MEGFIEQSEEERREQPYMEKNSAACAMEWSIELDNALRSRNPGRSVQAIHRIGQRLALWSQEPEPTMASSGMLGLISGEGRLFSNTILLRLADAFRFGDNSVRLAVVNIFRSELRNCKRRKGNAGILGKAQVQNQAELLRRVKVVFDTGDTESRALALLLFGCWADFAKDSAQIRYLILSTLVSSDDFEVKASLYAAGCFCELSDDFTLVVLEMLANLVTSCEISLAVRLAGVQIFAMMSSSFSVANRAFETGLKLVQDSSEEDLLVALLVSLSKLASKLSVLIPKQMESLASFLSQERTLRMRETAIRCMHFLLVQGVVYAPTSGHFVRTLLSTFDVPELSSALLQCQALQILHRILLYDLRNSPCMEMQECTNLITTIQYASKSPNLSKSLSAIRVMADISSNLTRRPEMGSDIICSSFHPMHLITLIIEQVTSLVNPSLDLDHAESQVSQYVKSLFGILLFLVGENPDLGASALHKVNLFVEYIVNFHGSVTMQEDLSDSDIEKFREKSVLIILKITSYINKFLVDYLENLNEVGGITTQVFDKVKTLVGSVHGCILFDAYMKTLFSILLHSRIIWGCMVNENKEGYSLDQKSTISLQNPSVEQEIFSLEFAKTLTEEDCWNAYRAGTDAACHGSWLTATFILGQLISKVQSDHCCCWLKSLVQLARSESKVQLLLLPKERATSMDLSEIIKTSVMHIEGEFNEIYQDQTGNMNATVLTKILVGAHLGICSSVDSLDITVTSGRSFCFQKWFLGLRAKVLGIVVEVLKIGDQTVFSNVGQTQESIMCRSLDLLQQITLRLKRLACEFDLIARSFIGIDKKSSTIISALALSCSLLAFTTGFSLFIPNLPAHGLIESHLQPVLLQNLIRRLKHIGCEISRSISLLLEVSVQPDNFSHLESRNLSLSIGCEARHVRTICSHAISRLVCLQNEASLVRSEDLLSKITKDGLQLVLDIVMKWIHIPFQIPKYFLKVRPCIGSELFVSNADSSSSNKILVSPGSHLSLNLCLWVKHLPSDLPLRLTKLYCVLSCCEEQKQAYNNNKPWETEDLVEMDEKLLNYVTECSKKINGKRRRNGGKDEGVVNAFARFELNEKQQGFTSCLLDVSNFPVGSYKISWHSCCIDNRGSYWSLLPLNAGPVFTVQ